MASIQVGDNCDLILYNSKVYLVGTTFTLLTGILNVEAASSDLYYIVTNNSLYAYSTTSKSYVIVQSLGGFMTYSLKASEDRIIVWGSNWAAAVNSTFDINQTVWVVTSSGSSLLTQWSLSAFRHPTNIVNVRCSP